MNWKKILLIAAVVGAFAVVSAPKSEARVSIGIGIGLPFPVVGVGYGYAPYGYAPYGYGYPRIGVGYGYYPYARPFYRRPYIYRRPVVVLRGGRPHRHR